MGLQRPAKQRISTRSVLMRAADNDPPAVGNCERYRPLDRPVDKHLTDGAGDALGTLRCLSSMSSPYGNLPAHQGSPEPL